MPVGSPASVPEGAVSLENDDLLDRYLAGEGPQLRVYEPAERAIVVGAGRQAAADVSLISANAAGVPLRKRRGGGGTVLLSPGQVVVALVTEVAHPFRNREYARRVNGWIAGAVAALLGRDPRQIAHRGISDLAVDDRKILGTSIFRRRQILFYQASLLVTNDVEEFAAYLRMPKIVPDYRHGRSHREFCTTLRECGYAGDAASVVAALHSALAPRLAQVG